MHLLLVAMHLLLVATSTSNLIGTKSSKDVFFQHNATATGLEVWSGVSSYPGGTFVTGNIHAPRNTPIGATS